MRVVPRILYNNGERILSEMNSLIIQKPLRMSLSSQLFSSVLKRARYQEKIVDNLMYNNKPINLK